MKQECTEIISDMASLWESIDYKKLRNHTKKCPRSYFGSIVWKQIEHLHILGSNNSEQLLGIRGGLERGAYVNSDHDWVLIIGPTYRQILNCLKACSARLKVLDIRFTDMEHIDLSHLTQLTQVNLSYNEKLLQISGLTELANLQELDLHKTGLQMPLDLRGCAGLKNLIISDTQIRQLLIGRTLSKLEQLKATDSPMAAADFLLQTPNLQVLDLAGTAVEQLPSLAFVPELRILDLSRTQISLLPGLTFLKKIEALYLEQTRIIALDELGALETLRILSLAQMPIRDIPEGVRGLRNLRRLNLSNLTLDDLPNWLPELGLRFNYPGTGGVLLRGTKVKTVESSILEQSHELIVQWFKMRSSDDTIPLNELKVVFLGDGEAGKTHTIARLLNDGDKPLGYDGKVTPGIAISHREYNIGDKQVHVHFWDFGGQEILHSMHRIFMTPRTLYVVLINARDNTQDERARYWLHNIDSFAKDARVLMVLNKMDQNPNASINETELRYRFSNLAGVVKLSALAATKDEFNQQFTSVLLNEIGKFKTLESPFLPAWMQIKIAIQNMETTHMTGKEFVELCQAHGEHNPKTVDSLLEWFNDLGISFCYRPDSREKGNAFRTSLDYIHQKVILKPEWITNAIYIILFNKRENGDNGVISKELICDLLGVIRDDVQRVLPGVTYSLDEIDYVLSVIRRFRLCYPMSTGQIFMPMLCQRNSLPVAMEYADDPRTLEFRVRYDYLPNNVIHRIMVDRRSELDTDNVWLTGALFYPRGSYDPTDGTNLPDRNKAKDRNKLSAVIRIDGNTLKINVRSAGRRAAANYLDKLILHVQKISDELELKISEREIAYKDAGVMELFDYDDLLGSQKCGIKAVYSKKLGRPVLIQDILNQTSGDDYEKRNQLIRDIQNICGRMQENTVFWDVGEDARARCIQDTLSAMRYIVTERRQAGMGNYAALAGEVDLEIRKEKNSPWTALEAMTINGNNPTQVESWNAHLSKLLASGAASGVDFLVLLTFVDCSREKFRQVTITFGNHLRNYTPDGFTLEGDPQYQADQGNFYLDISRCNYSCNDWSTEVYHIFVRMGR